MIPPPKFQRYEAIVPSESLELVASVDHEQSRAGGHVEDATATGAWLAVTTTFTVAAAVAPLCRR